MSTKGGAKAWGLEPIGQLLTGKSQLKSRAGLPQTDYRVGTTIRIIIPFLRRATALVHAMSLLALLVAVLATLPACRSSTRAKEHVEKGNHHFEQKQFADAESEYQRAIQIDPDLADAHYRLGLLESQKEHPTAATRSLSRAVELDPKNLDARLRLGNLLVSATQYGEAREQAEAVLSADSKNAGAHRLLGQIALQQMQYVAAENELKQAIQLDPRDPEAYADLGLAQLLDAEYGAAEESFQTAVGVRPDDPQTYINLANFYKGQNATDRAEKALHQGMTRNLKRVELPVALAGLYVERGRLPDAKRVLDQVEANGSDFPDGRRAVAEFYLTSGDAVGALQRFRALADKDVHDPATAKKVAECYLQLSRWQEANDWIDQRDHKDVDFRLLRARSDLGALRLREAAGELQSLLQDSPDVPAVYYYLAQVYVRQEEPAAAQQAFNEALRLQPGYLPAILGLGNVSLQQGNATVALNYASQVIATSFWLADAHVLAGSANLLREDLDQAQRAFELAVGLNPRSPEAQERLGKVLSLRENYPDAEKAYETSLALAPDYAPALNGLSEILVKQGKGKQASARIDRQIAAQPKAYQLLVAKAEFCITQRDWACAEHSYKRALAQNPYYVNGYLALAHIYAATNRPEEMIQQYEAARNKFPDYLPTYILLGQVYAYVGDMNRAQRAYQDALKVDPDFYLAQMNLARLFADHGGPLADALQLAQKAKATQPDDPNVNDTLGWVYYKQGLYASAVPVLEAAVTRSPKVAAFQFHLGMVYLAAGQRAQAHTSLQTSLNLGLNADDARAAQEALQKTGS
jgi:tetratricopeptide (TPR) repeat protein